MSNPWITIPPGPNPPDIVNVVVEVPRGGRNKYEMVSDKEQVYYQLTTVLSAPVFHNGDYGIIPQTIFDNGEPLDCLVVTNEPTFPGCVIESRPIAILEMITGEQRSDTVLAVPVRDRTFAHVKRLDDLPANLPKEIARYFSLQSELAGDVITEVLGWRDAVTARKVIAHSMRLFDKKVRPKLEIR